MRKQRIQWLVAACLLCLAQPAWAASESITYQDSLDSISESYAGEIQQPSTPERSNIRVVRRGASPITAPTEKLPTRVDADKMALLVILRLQSIGLQMDHIAIWKMVVKQKTLLVML